MLARCSHLVADPCRSGFSAAAAITLLVACTTNSDHPRVDPDPLLDGHTADASPRPARDAAQGADQSDGQPPADAALALDALVRPGDLAVSDFGVAADLNRRPDLQLEVPLGPVGHWDTLWPGAGIGGHCGRRDEGSVGCWIPWIGVAVPRLWPDRVNALYGGPTSGCALVDGGRAQCWSRYGEQARRFSSPPAETDFVQIGVSDHGACARHVGGELACWGWLGLWNFDPNNPNRINTPMGRFSDFCVGELGVCTIDQEGRGRCTRGLNETVPEGTGPFAFGLVSRVRCGGARMPNVCAWTLTGEPHCSGIWLNPANDVEDMVFVFSNEHPGACGLISDGSVRCWGRAFEPAVQPFDPLPWQQPPPGEFVAISAGLFNACALRTDGEVLCWGDPNYNPPPPGR